MFTLTKDEVIEIYRFSKKFNINDNLTFTYIKTQLGTIVEVENTNTGQKLRLNQNEGW